MKSITTIEDFHVREVRWDEALNLMDREVIEHSLFSGVQYTCRRRNNPPDKEISQRAKADEMKREFILRLAAFGYDAWRTGRPVPDVCAEQMQQRYLCIWEYQFDADEFVLSNGRSENNIRVIVARLIMNGHIDDAVSFEGHEGVLGRGNGENKRRERAMKNMMGTIGVTERAYLHHPSNYKISIPVISPSAKLPPSTYTQPLRRRRNINTPS